MPDSIAVIIPLLALTFLVAFVYSSVGHGGASGYLALLSLFSFPHDALATGALLLNLLVAGTAFRAFFQAQYFSWRLTKPLVAASVPAAFLGGLVKVSTSLYASLLICVLLFAAFRLWIDPPSTDERREPKNPSFFRLSFIGMGIGILSGIVGMGGGIFLSPLLLLFRWADVKQTATTSAFFIFANSLAGLLGRALRQNFQILPSPALLLLVVAAFLGGLVGSHLGANHFSGQGLKRVLAAVLIVATFKLLPMAFH